MFSVKNFVFISMFILVLAALSFAADERRDVTWNPQPATGESAAPMILYPSTTFSGTGDLLENMSWIAHNLGPHMLSAPYFWTDIRVRAFNGDSVETNQSMVCDSNGNLYVAWQDDITSMIYLQVYWSQDDGLTWKPFAFIADYNAELREPCVAVGQGNENKLLLAYIRDDGSMAVPEVGITSLSPGLFALKKVPVYSAWEGYAKPVIWTDAFAFPGWFAYLTCEGIFDSGVNNVNISAYRTKDYGDTWGDNNTVFGNTDTDEWVDPDGAFGTTQDRVFIACYNNTNDFLYKALSKDYGVSYGTFWVHNMTETGVPYKAVDPEIEASVNTDHVMICCTCANAVTDTIGFSWSPNAGDSFSSVFEIWKGTTDLRFAAALSANQGGTSFHLAYTGLNILYYSKRAQDLSGAWENPIQVDDVGNASNVYPKKGITSNWATNDPVVAWADFRDGHTDYDTYVDTPTKRYLEADKTTLESTMGGTVKFHLNAGTVNGSRTYLLLVGASGTDPGTKLPGGKEMPLKWDPLTDLALMLVNTPVLSNFYAKLDSTGKAMAYMTLPPIPTAAGVEMVFVYALNNPWNFVSNPWRIDILP